MAQTMPPPLPMQSVAAIVRTANEECANRFDADPSLESVSIRTDYGTMTCRKSKKGKVTVTIHPLSAPEAATNGDE